MAGDYEIDDRELGKRLSAGRGYLNETRAAFARRIDVNRDDLKKWEEGDFGSEKRFRHTPSKRETAVAKIQAESGLPLEFFSIDLAKLPKMVTALRQVQQESPQQKADSLERDEERSLPGHPSDSRNEEPTP